jgi:8-oxo-dGTP pyrophosphatase MutT (NUDIX family)
MEKSVYEGNFVRVTEEKIDSQTYERIHLKDSVVVFPITHESKILFIKEYRAHETPNNRWKPVTGHLESEGTPAEQANRELQEEIGKRAQIMEPFFDVKMTGTLNSHQYLFIARNLEDSKIPNPDGEETILETKALTLDEAEKECLEGKLSYGTVAYALLRFCHEVKEGRIRL